MTTYSVSTAAQALYPDGYNDAMTLYNQGPWTVFIDENSSVGTQSYALKPSTTMVWPACKPLWVKGNKPPSNISPVTSGTPYGYSLGYQDSTLIVTRGSYSSANQFATKALFPIRRSAYDEEQGFTFSTDYPFEADSYNSLIITINQCPWETVGDNPSITALHQVNLLWFDESGTLVTTDRYNLSFMGFTSNNLRIPQRIITPVVAKYCLITHENYDYTVTVKGLFNWTVQGTTDTLSPRVDHWVWQSAIDLGGTIDLTRFNYSPIWNRNQNNGTTQVAGLFLGNDAAYIDNWQNAQNIYLNNVSRTLTVTYRSAGVTTAGTVVIRTLGPNSGNQILSSTAIATGTAVYGPITVNVPISVPIRIQTAGGLVGPMNISLVWS